VLIASAVVVAQMNLKALIASEQFADQAFVAFAGMASQDVQV
jgi:hypothetical protein